MDTLSQETALVIIDLQKGIAAMSTSPHSAEMVIHNAARLAGAFRDKGGFVVLVHVETSAGGKDALVPITDSPRPAFQRLPDWAEIVPELGPEPDDHLISKRQWGAFYGTDLDLQLRRRGIKTLVLTGISTCFGVESTARDAYERGYQQVFVEDAMAAQSAEEHRHTIQRIFSRMGRVRDTEMVLAALSSS